MLTETVALMGLEGQRGHVAARAPTTPGPNDARAAHAAVHLERLPTRQISKMWLLR